MDEGLKKRLVGATVLVSLIVIFVPMLLENEPIVDNGISRPAIPPRPPAAFPSRVLPEDDENIGIPPLSVSNPSMQIPPTPAEVVDNAPPAAANLPAASESAVEQPPPAVRPQLSGWVIQAGSFSNSDNADKLTQQLRAKGFPAFVEQAQVRGKAVARVLVGPEVDRQLAERLMSRLNRELGAHKLVGKLKVYAGPGNLDPE